MTENSKPLKGTFIFGLVIIAGIFLRLLVAARGYNYDMQSYMIVADIVANGGNVYEQTTRYNYGPVWFHILNFIDLTASISSEQKALFFRFIITCFLTIVDIGIFFILSYKYNRTAAYLFFLNPISIIITGYHSQFDNLAIFLGMVSLLIMDDNFEMPINRRKIFGLIILGFSLMTKHVLFAFPLWIALKQKGIFHKAVVIIIPVSIFLCGFLPYLHTGYHGIIRNVFQYGSCDNPHFYQLFIPEILAYITSGKIIWFLLLIIFAFVVKRQNAFDSLLLYTGILVAASPSISNQYLSIVIPFISVNFNILFAFYTIVGCFHLLINKSGLHLSLIDSLTRLHQDIYYAILICLLTFGIVWTLWGKNIIKIFKRIMLEVQEQFRYEIFR